MPKSRFLQDFTCGIVRLALRLCLRYTVKTKTFCAIFMKKDCSMPIVTFPLGPLETNCYLIHNDTHALAVDVGGDPADVLD